MRQREKRRTVSPDLVARYQAHLREQERADATVQKYIHDLTELAKFLPHGQLTKLTLIEWKESLSMRYSAASVNTMLAAVNGFLTFMGWQDWKVKPLKIQRQIFRDAAKELTKEEYFRLVKAARSKGNERLALLLQTICGTGIRVSELQFITVEGVLAGRVEVNCKGKRRTVFLPENLRKTLLKYLRQQKRTAGPVFVSKTGIALNRSNIWRDMKALCEDAGVTPGKVFPHNLRHLFARTYYSLEKDLSRLADILGHSSIATTRIYTAENGTVHQAQIERLGLFIT